MTMIDTADSRFAKAVAIADQAGQWLRCRAPEGKKAYGIRSSRDPTHVYFVTQSSCSCEDQRRHPALACKHRIGVAIHVARLAGKPMPASDALEGLEQMVINRHPVLEMVRHADGEIRWEPHQHPGGDTFYMPRRTTPPLSPETIALAAKYDAIHKRFDDNTSEQIMGRLSPAHASDGSPRAGPHRVRD